MSDGADWHDPFAEDPDAIERERRRAEREAKRRGSRKSVGDKVEQASAPVPSQPPAEQPSDEQRTTSNPPTAEEPVVTPPPAPQPSSEQRATRNPPTASQPLATPPATGAPPPRSPNSLRNRRLIGAAVFLILLAVLIFGAVKVIGKLTEPDPPPAPKAKPVKTSDILIPEGYDRHQIADVAKKAGLKGDYEQASQSFKGFDLKKYGAEDAPSLEGFLFPATYEVPKKGTVKDLISRQLDAFEQNMAGVDMSYAKSKNLTTYDVLKIASMIEREVAVAKERPLVAEVIYNRLKAGTPLGIDATIRYEDQNYDEQLLESRLQEDTPYNTRTHPGLPPTPIGNPGLDSIEAAANPAKGDLFYFVVKPGSCNEHVFVETDAEFQQAEQAYQQALQEQGGSPTDC